MSGPTWDDLRGALAAAPEAAGQPSIAASLVQSGFTGSDLVGAAQGAVGAVQSSAADGVVQAHKKQGIFSHLTTAVTHAVSGVWDSVPGHGVVNDAANEVGGGLGTVAKWANYPLAQVQHSYRYYRDVQQHHGNAAALGEWLKNSWGGLNPVAGVAQPYIAHVEDQTGIASYQKQTQSNPLGPSFGDSWDRSANAQISPGRDLAGLFQLKPGSMPYHLVSGTGDAAFDILADPLMKAGTVSKAITGSARVLATGDDVVRLANASRLNPAATPFKRAISDIANTNSSVQIGEKYQPLRNITTTLGKGTDAEKKVALTTELAKADTEDKVIDVLRNHFEAGSYLGYSGTPTYSLTKVLFRNLNEMSQRWQQDPKGLLDQLATDPDAGSIHTGAFTQFKSGVGRAVNAFTNKTPFVFTPDNRLVSDAVDPASPQAAHVLYRVLKYGQSESTAAAVADGFANAPTIANKVQIWNKAIVGLANAVGLPDDAEFRARFIADLDGHAAVTGTGSDTVYGINHLGEDQSFETMADGTKVASPLFTTQGGLLTIPSLAEFNSAARAVRTFGKMYGPMDDFVYKAFTAGYFKKLSLLSGGFPIRAALSEDMTRVIGGDGMKIIHSAITVAAHKLGLSLHPGQLEDVAAQVGYSADPEHYQRLIDSPTLRESAIEFSLRHDTSLMTNPDMAAGHTIEYDAGDTTSNMFENVKRMLVPGHHGVRYDPNRYVKVYQSDGIERLSNAVTGHANMMAHEAGMRVQARAYRDALDSGATQDDAARAATDAGVDWFKNTAEGKAAQDYIKRATLNDDPNVDNITNWAGARTGALRGVTSNKDAEVIRPILDGIADAPSDASLTHPNLLPSAVKKLGLDNLPVNGVPGMAIAEMPNENMLPRLVNAGYSKVIAPIIQGLARSPIFQAHLNDELQIALKIPGLTRDEAFHMAESRASERMIQEIHNPLDKSMFAQTVRNLIPFYFAREQAYTRFIKAMHEDPFGWRKLQLAVHGMKDNGFIHTDPQTGQDYFNYPYSAELGKFMPMVFNKLNMQTAIGVPSGFRGDITGLAPGGDVPGDSPISVGWSPLLTVPMHSLANIFPELRPAVDSSLGVGAIGAHQGLWDQLVPNATMRNVINAYAGDHQKAFTNSMFDAMQYQMAHGNMPPTNSGPGDKAWQEWIDGIRNQTRAMFLLKALVGIGSPTSPILENGDHGMTAEFQALVAKDGLSVGTQEFLAKNPHAGAYTIFRTEGAGSTNVPETTVAWDWTKANEKFVVKNGEAGSLFIPQTSNPDPNALAIYQQQLAEGFRHQKSPDEFAQQVMVQQGWNTYEADKAVHDAAVAKLTDPNAISAENSNWYAHVTNDLGPSAPLWFADYNDNTARNAQKKIVIGQLQKIFADGKQPDSPMTPLIQGLLSDFTTYQTELANSATSPESKTEIKDHWNTYLAQQVQENPQLTTIVNRVFKGQ